METLAGRPGPGRRRAALTRTLLALSLTVLVATPIGWAAGRPDPDVGSPPIALQRGRPPADPPPGGGLFHRGVSVHSGRLADQKPAPAAAAPVRIRIAVIGLNAPVVPVGVDVRTGTVQIPQDVRTVGWYRFGATPGSEGAAVVVGHVDSREQGAGAFFRLQELQPGAAVAVQLADGSMARFEVVARRFYPKSRLPKGIFQPSGRPLLSLVTCGGPFDRSTGHYADNVVVYAVLKGLTPPRGDG